MRSLWLPGPLVVPTNPSRRAVLRGAGGVALALPFLESLAPRARADGGDGRYAVFVRQANGVTQADGDEPDGFWPQATGALTSSALAAQTDRVLSELAVWAPKMIALRGVNFNFDGNGCGHSGGGNQCLTAAQVSADPSGADSLSMGESIDNYIARHFPDQNGGEPLTLYTGPRNNYIEEVLSYRGPLDLRAAEDDPWNAYKRMVGLPDFTPDPLLDKRRVAVNDILREQLESLRASPKLSASDLRRLDTHLEAVREFERLTCELSQDELQMMMLATGQGTLNESRVTFAKWHMDLIALAFACDFARAATLQIGDGNDATEFTINGQLLPSFHFISHRIYSDGAEGEAIEGAYEMHNAIDRLFAGMFDHLLSRLDEHGVLDRSVAVWCNDLGTGPGHSYTNVPYILVGEAGGALNTGYFHDLGGVTNNKLFNSIATAVGVTAEDGGPVTTFGDPSLEQGLIDQIMA
ncbi:MAG: DUF1552 domain-containing protein [Deltaproteobacteria bacterium]|nr:DUF1552 domain-containing protein [Deltaproteobacteria bacterium]